MKEKYFNRTKIIATIGPACDSESKLLKLIKTGVDVFRINFSHGSHEYAKKIISRIRNIEKKYNFPIAILGDLQGPKIRLGDIAKPFVIKKNQIVYFHKKNKLEKNPIKLPVTYKKLINDVNKNDIIFINDGLIKIKVISKSKTEIKCKVLIGGVILSHKGINLPNTKISASSVSKKDLSDLNFAINNDIDFIAISFVREKKDVMRVKKILDINQSEIQIISKIEKPEAVENINDIIEVSDGIMVARGDLGVEIPIENTPLVQKELIAKCNEKGKVVITATQMLESMIKNYNPTRAEVSDVANAVFDGTDALMLSGETSVGDYPEKTVEIMAKIVLSIENKIYNDFTFEDLIFSGHNYTDAIASSACIAAHNIDAKCIVITTHSGNSALLVSKHKPNQPIYGITLSHKAARHMKLYWGVFPILTEKIYNIEVMFNEISDMLLKNKLCKKNDFYVITAGVPFQEKGQTNTLSIRRI